MQPCSSEQSMRPVNISFNYLTWAGCPMRLLWMHLRPAAWEIMESNYMRWFLSSSCSLSLPFTSFTQLPLFHTAFPSFYKPDVDTMPSQACKVYNTDLNSTLFSLHILCFTVPLSLPPRIIVSSLSLAVCPSRRSSPPDKHSMIWLLCVITICTALHVFVRISLCENTFM